MDYGTSRGYGGKRSDPRLILGIMLLDVLMKWMGLGRKRKDKKKKSTG